MKAQKKSKKWIVIVSVVLIAVLSICFVVSGIGYYSVMNKHINTRDNARGIASFEDYKENGLKRIESNFLSDKNIELNGFYYWNQEITDYKGIIIVNNGFGSGHEGMLGEIEALTANGYLVYGFDKTGFDGSGENVGVGTISQGVHDLLGAIEHVKLVKNELGDFSGVNNIILYGKSYGAYCCLAVLNLTSDVSSVISMSAFNHPTDMMDSETNRILGKFGCLFIPFIRVFSNLNEENLTAYNGLEKTSANVLIMHSSDDPVVSEKISYDKFLNLQEKKSNIHFILYNDKQHILIKSEASVKQNDKMDEDLQIFFDEYTKKATANGQPNNGQMTDEMWDEFLSQYDLRISTEPDAEVMKTILDFLQ